MQDRKFSYTYFQVVNPSNWTLIWYQENITASFPVLSRSSKTSIRSEIWSHKLLAGNPLPTEPFRSCFNGWVEDFLHSRDVLFDRQPVGDLIMFYCNRSQRTRGVKRSLLIQSVNKKICMQKTCKWLKTLCN